MTQRSSKNGRPLRVLVTGGAGFLGRHLVTKLLGQGCEVVALVRQSSDYRWLQDRGVRLVFGDVRDPAVLQQAMVGVQVVVHAAATMAGSWEDFYAINVESTRKLLELCKKRRIKRFVYISSVSVYDHTRADEGFTFTEDMPFQTEQLAHYSRSKIEAEKVVREYVDGANVPCVILRPGALYGVGGPLYPAQLGLPLGATRFALIGSGESVLPLCHVQSVADAMWLAIGNRSAVGKAYNIMEAETISRKAFLTKVRATVNPRLRVLPVPYWFLRSVGFGFQVLFSVLGRRAPLRPLYLKTASTSLFYSTKKIERELGWKPGVEFAKSISEFLRWHRDRRVPRRPLPVVDGKVEIPSDRSVRVGVVGCGAIAEVHLGILSRIPNAQIIALADPAVDARERLAQKYRVRTTFDTLSEMLRREKPEVVHILAPAQLHAELAVEAMESGCHVLVEKPMALNAREAKRMAAVARKKKVKLSVGHNHLFDRVMLQAREILARGELGRITYVESWYGVSLSSDAGNRALSYEARDAWFYRMPGSLYQDFISHPISLLMDVMPEVRLTGCAAGYFRVVPYMQTDELRVLLKSDEVLGTLCVSLAASPRYQFMRVYGTEGTMTVDVLNKYVFVDRSPGFLPKTISRNLSSIRRGKTLLGVGLRNLFHFMIGKLSLFEGTERMIRLFYRSVLLDEPVPVSPEEGLQSMRLMDEIWRRLGTKENGRLQQVGRKELQTKTRVVTKSTA